jgi:hypothetical protein
MQPKLVKCRVVDVVCEKAREGRSGREHCAAGNRLPRAIVFATAPGASRYSPQSASPQGWKQTVGTDVVRANDQDTAMRPSLFILGIFAAVLCVAQSAAAQDYPWCAYYGPHFGATNCGFSTFQQCLATISGIGGSCGANPMYQPAPGPHRSTRHPRRYSY